MENGAMRSNGKLNMRAASIILSCALFTQSALAQDIPYAAPPSPRAGQTDVLSIPSLGDIMLDTQLRHIKLWQAGRAGNWDLMKFELDRISDGLRKAALLYSNIPIEYVTGMGQPLLDMHAAAAEKDEAKFSRAFTAFTQGCNACHANGGVGFVRIQTPVSSPFSNEVFATKP